MTVLNRYLSTLADVLAHAQASVGDGQPIAVADAIDRTVKTAAAVHGSGGKVMFVGNGGSAGIASHMAIDWLKNGGIRALAFNDGAALTCLGNDLGYENVFARQIAMHGRPEDLLVAISSSGRSPNILRSVEAARSQGCQVLTLSGFDPDNPLRRLGDLNLYVPSGEYGFVEIAHLVLLHAVVDLSMGWGAAVAEQEGVQS